jgi:adenine-specific DNA-methyltransferase
MEVDRLVCGEARAEMGKLPANSVNLILVDPPYFKVKSEKWDNQWDSPALFLDWIGQLCQEWQRILKPNGSLYCFASPKMAARVEVKISEYFNILNRITWKKNDGTHNEGGLWSRADKDILCRKNRRR